jgi:hypothetical protein
MRHRSTLTALLLLSACSGSAPRPTAIDPPITSRRISLASFGWLVGEWRGESEDHEFVERWSAPADGAMTGEGLWRTEGRVQSTERLRLEQREGGELVYVASPTGQATTEFPLISLSNDGDTREAVFENPAHDFPRRIVYQLTGRDALLAAIEGPGGESGTRRIEFRMQRVAPEATPPR